MSKLKFVVVACICAVVGTTASVALAAPGDTLGISTLMQRIFPQGAGDFKTLQTGPGEDYTVRTGSAEAGELGVANPGRETKRTPLAYFGQLTDFQLADEESPARVEFLDPEGGPFTASWRPSEAFNPFEANEMIEQMNSFAANAPVASGDGSLPPMDFVMNTGDISDSQQFNETVWNRTLIEGGTITPGSGVNPASSIDTNPLCPSAQIATLGGIKDAATPTNYTGVQDRDDWPGAKEFYFYDPDEPNPALDDPGNVNPYADAPMYPGLMDQGQKPFQATGLDVPGYVLFGNHDGLVQGNAYASKLFNQFAQGCLKPIADKSPENSAFNPLTFLSLVTNPNLDVAGFLDLVDANPNQFMAVPPDPDRRLISKTDYKNIFRANGQDNDHGFGFIDPAEEAASNGAAGYYSFSPSPDVRYITLDTHSEGGKILESDKGNLDASQFSWFESELQEATDENQIAVIFSHHAPSSMTANVLDENAPSCASVNPAEVVGCDGDPRDSAPIKLKDDAIALMHKYPAAVAWVAGHSHENKIEAFKDPAGNGGFWSIRTSALVDWPKQNRLIEIFDNEDGNLSIFGTLIDHAAPVPAPAPGTNASTFDAQTLASVGRTIGYNDNQNGGESCGSIDPCGAGTVADRNVELLIKDPRRTAVPVTPKAKISKVKVKPNKKKLRAGKKTKLTVKVTNSGDAPAKKVKVRLKSTNKRVKVKNKIVIKKIAPGKTAKVKIKVRAKNKARGKAKIKAIVGKRKGSAVVKIKARKN
ncbi:MAG: CARDB domain-containing protein [Solirubrobacterales bacterium]